MVKKISISNKKTINAETLQSIKNTLRSQRVRLEQKPDYFIKNKDNLASQTEGLEFKTKKVIFSPEDIEKMKTMSTQERIAYKRELKKAGKYKTEDE